MKLDYKVIYSDRKTISLIIERDRSIVVRAPKNVSENEIQRVVEAKKLWLFEKVQHPQKYLDEPVKKEFITGESLLYLGRNYRLEITEEDYPGVRFQSRFYISRKHKAEAGTLLREWYIGHANEKLPPMIRSFANSMGVVYNQIRVMNLKYRWASCTPKNNLNFNWRIIKAPIYVIDYLIAHELAHIIEHYHNQRFWNIVAVQVPNYEQAKDWLRVYGHTLEEEFP